MEITEIKSRLSLESVLSQYNLVPDRSHKLKCPFHDDKDPSLQVYPKTNSWTCFSSNCNVGSGDVIDFIMKYENISKAKAIVKAKEMISPGTGTVVINPGSNGAVADKGGFSMKGYYDQFKQSLQRSGKAKGYLKERGLEGQEDVGYNPKTATARMKYCLIFPLRDREGEISSFYGRSIINDDRAKHYYSANRSGLYPCYPASETRSLILTESVIDAASLMQITEITERYTVLALYGTNGLGEEHREVIGSLSELKDVVMFFDGDAAGRKAVEKHSTSIHGLLPDLGISYVKTPDDEDINSLWVKYGKEAILQLLQERDFLFSTEDPGQISSPGPSTEEPEAAITKPSDEKKRVGAGVNPDPSQKNTPRLNTKNPEYITFATSGLLFTLLGGINLYQLDRMRVTLKVGRFPQEHAWQSIRHTIDFYNDDVLEKFLLKASERLDIESRVLRVAMAELTEQLEAYRLHRIESLKTKVPVKRILSPERERRAIKYLQSPDLLKRTNQDIGRAGVVGERTNRLLMYLVFTSRLRAQPLHIISLGSSGSGKTYLQERISELIPEQERLEITILSENAFYYFEKKELKQKLVLIEDMDGAENVLYPLRELQSKRKISKTIPIKDSKGNLKTITLHVEGPICLAGTTTRERLYEDNANRSLLIYLDGSAGHREQIMEYQRRLSAGKINSGEEHRLREFFKDMQSVLKPVRVINPYAELLKLPESIFKPLRTNAHYLQFIEVVTFYHQWQRELKTASDGSRYIETALEDIEAANGLLKDVLLAKSDELAQAVREFFERLKRWMGSVDKESFYGKEVRDAFRISSSSCNRYILELLRNNYIRVIGGNRHRKGYEYEVVKRDEYRKLQEDVKTVLDKALDHIKNQYPSVPPVSQGEDGILKGNYHSELRAVSQ